MSLRLVNWNVEWATPRSRRTPEILSRIERHAPEIVCLTEAHTGLLSRVGHTICSRPDYGYSITVGRRKVLLWSREPWEQVDDLGLDSLPPGRFVAGVTRTSIGKIRVVGVCVPWSGSRSEARRKSERKRRWEDHGKYLAGLAEILRPKSSGSLILVGDFNQRIRQGHDTPRNFQAALQCAIPPYMTIATAALGFQGRRSIDHIAISEDLTADSLCGISNVHGEGKLSDHFGVLAALSARDIRRAPSMANEV